MPGVKKWQIRTLTSWHPQGARRVGGEGTSTSPFLVLNLQLEAGVRKTHPIPLPPLLCTVFPLPPRASPSPWKRGSIHAAGGPPPSASSVFSEFFFPRALRLHILLVSLPHHLRVSLVVCLHSFLFSTLFIFFCLSLHTPSLQLVHTVLQPQS